MKIQYTYKCEDCGTVHRIDIDTSEEIADAIRRIKRKIANAGKVNPPEDTAEPEKAVKLLELEQAKRRVAAMMAEIGIEG